jgi:hypothetical protein
MCAAGKKRLAIMKRVAGVDWESSTNVLVTTYKTYVKPLLEYDSAVLVIAPKNHISKPNMVQNPALHIATGATKSTPIVVMHLHTCPTVWCADWVFGAPKSTVNNVKPTSSIID